MNREDFTEGSVGQALFDLWDGRKEAEETAFILRNRIPKKELVDFIMEAQSKGVFGHGYIHP